MNGEPPKKVASWEGCSILCSKRRGCKYWLWHHENAGKWAYDCITMTDAKGSWKDDNTVAGTAGCAEKPTVTEILGTVGGFLMSTPFQDSIVGFTLDCIMIHSM